MEGVTGKAWEMELELLPLVRGKSVITTAAVVLCTFWVLSKLIFSGRKRKSLPPGPRPWPLLGNLPQLGVVPHQALRRLAQVYGPLMYLRLGSIPTYVVSSPELAKQILRVHDKAFASRPSLTCGDIMGYGCQNFGFMPLGDQWRSLRKLFTTDLISKHRVDQASLKTIRAEEIDRMMKMILEESQDYSDGKPAVKIFAHFFRTSSNIISRMAFGKRLFGSSTSSTFNFQKFEHDIEEVVRLFGVFNVSDFIPSLKKFDLQGYEKQMWAAHKELDGTWQLLLDARREEIRQRSRLGVEEDFLDMLLSRPLETTGKPMTDDQTKALLLDVLLAGTDTTAITLEWAMTELLTNRKVLNRAQRELDEVVGGGGRPAMEWDFQRLDYLHAVIKEVLRMHPAGALMVPHESVEDCVVSGYHIPALSRVIVNVSAIGRDPAVWDRASEFRPERFLDNEGKCKLDVIDMDYKLLPFGSGRRSCPGMPLALRIIEHTLAVLLHTCRWDVPRDDQGQPKSEILDMSEVFALGVSKKLKLEVVATLR